MQKYEFSIRTRNGPLVERIRILGCDVLDAERKLRQMYANCDIIRQDAIDTEKTITQSAGIEDVLTLLARHN